MKGDTLERDLGQGRGLYTAMLAKAACQQEGVRDGGQ